MTTFKIEMNTALKIKFLLCILFKLPNHFKT